jgi:hypothetical protein
VAGCVFYLIMKSNRGKAIFMIIMALIARITVAIPPATLLAVAASYVGLLTADSSHIDPTMRSTGILIIVCVGIPIILIQTFGGYKKVTYDVTLILRCWDMFDELTAERFVAIKRVIEIKNRPRGTPPPDNIPAEVQPVLDIFEDIGLLLWGQQISDAVAYHYFYHWVLLYMNPLEGILSARENARDVRYTKLLFLFDRLRAVEQMNMGILALLENQPIPELDEDEYQSEIDDNAPPI